MVSNSDLFEMFQDLKAGQTKLIERVAKLESNINAICDKIDYILERNSIQDQNILKNTKFRVAQSALSEQSHQQLNIELKKLAIFVSLISTFIYFVFEVVVARWFP